MKKKLIFILTCMSMFLLGSATMFISFIISDNITQSLIASVSIFDSDCSRTDVREASYCLRNELRGWYDYNITNTGKKMSLEQLQTNGGVCEHYADWYIEKLKDLGYEARGAIFTLNETTSHKIAIASTEEGYCILDQLTISCIRLSLGGQT